jgi:hypothetical protein
VVSSDHEVQSAAKVNHASALTSEEFRTLLQSALSTNTALNTEDKPLSSHEVDEWLRIFRGED